MSKYIPDLEKQSIVFDPQLNTTIIQSTDPYEMYGARSFRFLIGDKTESIKEVMLGEYNGEDERLQRLSTLYKLALNPKIGERTVTEDELKEMGERVVSTISQGENVDFALIRAYPFYSEEKESLTLDFHTIRVENKNIADYLCNKLDEIAAQIRSTTQKVVDIKITEFNIRQTPALQDWVDSKISAGNATKIRDFYIISSPIERENIQEHGKSIQMRLKDFIAGRINTGRESKKLPPSSENKFR